MDLASRMKQIKPSPTLALNAKAGALKAAGVDVLNFAAGEPDFDTPETYQGGGKSGLSRKISRVTRRPGGRRS